MPSLFLGGVFSSKKTKKFLKKVQNISKLTNKVNKTNKILEEEEFKLLLENKDDFYISLADIMELINTSNLKMPDIYKKCKHVGELDRKKCSVLEVYAVPTDDGHLLLCPDTKTCKKHKNFAGDKIRITTIKR